MEILMNHIILPCLLAYLFEVLYKLDTWHSFLATWQYIIHDTYAYISTEWSFHLARTHNSTPYINLFNHLYCLAYIWSLQVVLAPILLILVLVDHLILMPSAQSDGKNHQKDFRFFCFQRSIIFLEAKKMVDRCLWSIF